MPKRNYWIDHKLETFDRSDLTKYQLEVRPDWFPGQRAYVRRYKLVVSAMLRTVPHGCDIHHIDGCKFNDNPDNLWVCSREEHFKLHQLERKEYLHWVKNRQGVVINGLVY